MQIILPHTFLEKVDKVSMWHSIEARVPLLDNDLVDYVMRLPSNYKLRGGLTKSFFREIVSDLLPEEILKGRKISFGTPMDEWMRTTLHKFSFHLIEKARSDWSHILNFDKLLEILEQHKRGIDNYGSLLWRATVLIIWLNRYKSKIGSHS
jgi:asparagine synthase (glutamine-hydrolysing)